MFMFARWKIMVAVAVFYLLSLGGVYLYAYTKGKNGCELANAQEQVKVEEKARKSYEKIIKNAPINAPKRDAIEWLSRHTRQ